MKKIISLIFVITLLCGLAACGVKNDNIMEINISNEAKPISEGIMSRKVIDDDEVAAFEKSILAVANRGEQVLPKVNVRNKLEKEVKYGSNVYTLSKDNYENIVLYIHGGAWTYEINEMHVTFCDDLVERLNAKVYMPLYPLSPQGTYKEAFSMLHNLYKELTTQNKKIMVMGDSAGGNLTLNLMKMIKDNNDIKPYKLVALAPCADMSFSNPDIVNIEKNDPMLKIYECRECGRKFLDGLDLKDPNVSPLYADVTGYSDTLFIQGTNDILCPDNLLLFDKMKKSGVKAKFIKGNGLWHVFPIFNIPEKEICLKEIVEFCK